jgi:formylglycine-generating enzyme required for sulfatase activity
MPSSVGDVTLPGESDLLGGPREEVGGSLGTGALIADRYEVLRLLGEGGMGRVYLARDPILLRKVAIKLLLRSAAEGSASGPAPWEAQITARFNHPNIVTIHDSGLHRGAPYLALEFVEGETLADRLLQGRLSIGATVQLGLAVASALEYAHARKVWHCDLKPSNILLPRDGRCRVLDFGLASLSGGTTGPRGGTPSHMAPEQWNRGELTGAVDVWALGVILVQCLSGTHPFRTIGYQQGIEALRREPATPMWDAKVAGVRVPPGLDDLIRGCRRLGPEDRPTAREVREVLSGLVEHRDPAPNDGVPFVGLQSFEEQQAAAFFGREGEVDAIVERLRFEATLVVVGPSGSGKSSLIKAGVIPRLRSLGDERVFVFRPGAKPFQALASALSGPTRPPSHDLAKATEELRRYPISLRRVLLDQAGEAAGRVVLFVDQLEEVLALPEAEAQAFLGILFGTADDPSEPIRVVASLRSDFIDRLPKLDRVFVVGAMDAGRLKRVVSAPLLRTGYRLDDPSILDEMVNDLSAASSSLPLLQFACRALWDARDTTERTLPSEVYRQRGGVLGMLSAHADQVVDSFSVQDYRAARRLLLALVAPTGARRALPLAEARSVAGPSADRIVERLVDSRLLCFRREGSEGEASIEFVHEALILRWARLRGWLESTSADLSLLQRIRASAEYWERRGRRRADCLTAEEIGEVRRVERSTDLQLPGVVERFVEASSLELIRRRRLRVGLSLGAVGLAVAISLGSMILAQEFRARQLRAEHQAEALRLAGGNIGKFQLTIEPFDWDPRTLSIRPALEGHVELTVYRASALDPFQPGAALSPVQGSVTRTSTVSFVIEAPGIPLLAIERRPHLKEPCGPAWVPLANPPGFADRDRNPIALRVPVPTCAATGAGMILVPEGEWIDWGAGDPPTPIAEDVHPELVRWSPNYLLDATEVTNAQFEPFARLSRLTGVAVPRFPSEGLLAHSGEATHPVTGLDARTAEAFCAYLGKRLPSSSEWTKAARGGLRLGPPSGAPNPMPRRQFPWGVGEAKTRAAVETEVLGVATAPVASFSQGAGPYGHLDLVGNVREWTAQAQGETLRVVRGGAWSSPLAAFEHSVTFENRRDPRYFDFATGIRCARWEEAGPWRLD